MLSGILVVGGYAVIAEAATGLEAIERYREHRRFLILMDVAMPGMYGVEVAGQLAKVDGDARILLCGAFETEELTGPDTIPGVKGRISKPFKAEVLGVLQGLQDEEKL
ncbi:MAG TPA: response regulator [Desulfuromonadales bacterium]|nr:response regulator [Desulfuromonadales bacterium]